MPKPSENAASPSSSSIDVRHSTIHGHGSFAARDIPRGQLIGIYDGRRYGPDEADARDWNHTLTYVFGLSDGSIIDGSEGGNATRHINHSCRPNCVAYEVDDGQGGLRVEIEAKRRIAAGEELFLDYALDVGGGDAADYACRCGARRCRGTMLAAVAA